MRVSIGKRSSVGHSTETPSLTKRAIIYLAILLLLQCLIAYGALLAFDALPESITDIPREHVIQRQVQKGTVNLIRLQIAEHPELSPQQVLANLQPDFGYPLMLVSSSDVLPEIVMQDLLNYSIAYDYGDDYLYATLNDTYRLKLGPIIAPDILEANTMSFWLYLLLWSVFSAAVFFAIFYFAFAHLWRDALNIRQTAEQLANGDLKARVNSGQGWLFKPLSNVLNNMAAQVEQLVTTSQTMSHAMAHELRTPLARIRFELSMIEDSNNEREKQAYINGIKQDMNELEALINVSLGYFKMQQNRIDIHLAPIALQEWANNLCESLTILKPNQFELICQCDDIKVNIDTQLTNIVIKNLLLNGFKYANNKVQLNIYKKESQLIIEVDDDGPGVPLQYRDKIFVPFSRLDTSRTRTTGGYGLGLAYVKLIAEAHNGSAFVVTSPLGGARFIVTLAQLF